MLPHREPKLIDRPARSRRRCRQRQPRYTYQPSSCPAFFRYCAVGTAILVGTVHGYTDSPLWRSSNHNRNFGISQGSPPFPQSRQTTKRDKAGFSSIHGGGQWNPSGRSAAVLRMVLTTPESIIEQASTQKLLDILLDESTRTTARRPIMMQFDPSSGAVSDLLVEYYYFMA